MSIFHKRRALVTYRKLYTLPYFSPVFLPLQVHDGEFNWDATLQGVILGSFYYGFCLTQLPGGLLSERFSGKWVFGGGILAASCITLLYPIAAKTHVALLIFLRACQGRTKRGGRKGGCRS